MFRLFERKEELLLRVGVAFVFLYPPISAFFNPFAWIGYFPPLLLDAAGESQILLLHTFGVIEIVLALWILFGKHIFLPSLAAALMLFLIVGTNWSQMDVLFRDLPIALMAVVLALRHRPHSLGG